MTISTDSWHSYPKVYAMGHPAIEELFAETVLVEEKIDGSQFSFGSFGGVLRCKSKGKELVLDAVEKMFAPAVETAKRLQSELMDGWTYRGEYLQKPHHNGLAYDRIPSGHIILFDINDAPEKYLSRADKEREAARLGMEIVPCFAASVKKPEDVLAMMENVSILGGCKVEGMVFKQYKRFGPDGKCLMGKYVREDFREIQGKTWKEANPTGADIITRIGDGLRTPARWEKGVQHLRDRGELTDSPKDIGALLKEVQKDIEEECEAEIKKALYAHAIGHIRRHVIAGLPEWYKAKLLARQFTVEERIEKIEEKGEFLKASLEKA